METGEKCSYLTLRKKKSRSRFLLQRIYKVLLIKPGSLLQILKSCETWNSDDLPVIFIHMLVENKNYS